MEKLIENRLAFISNSIFIMVYFKQFLIFAILIFLASSCRNTSVKNKELLFWCSNNNGEIKFATKLTSEWNTAHPANSIHLQPIPEGQSSEEVILAAVVGKTTPDIYGNMWQGNYKF